MSAQEKSEADGRKKKGGKQLGKSRNPIRHRERDRVHTCRKAGSERGCLIVAWEERKRLAVNRSSFINERVEAPGPSGAALCRVDGLDNLLRTEGPNNIQLKRGDPNQ